MKFSLELLNFTFCIVILIFNFDEEIFMNNIVVLVIIAEALVFFFCGYLARKFAGEKKVKRAEMKTKEMLENAQKQIESEKQKVKLEAKERFYKLRVQFERETKGRRYELLDAEKRLNQKEMNLERKFDLCERKERELHQRNGQFTLQERALQQKKKELNDLLIEEKEKLHRISNLSKEEAKDILLNRIQKDVEQEKNILLKRAEDEIKRTSEQKSKQILSLAMQKCASDYVSEATVSVVSLPNDEMKGRIIGREGRNIRALEMATGIDIIVDDTPEAVVLSGFDAVRREIARITLERLTTDGRIHPARIEEVVTKVKEEMQQAIYKCGEEIAFEAGVQGLHPEEIKLLGKFKHRTSYGQNVLQHSLEVALLMGAMAAELKENVTLARRIGLLHDIGKSVDREVEGTHAEIGANLAKRYGESPIIVNAIAAHHEDKEAESVLAVLVQAADALSASRPGVRRETVEMYVKRLENLENIAKSFPGVEKSFAMHAGREMRVIVQSNKISDLQVIGLAHDITKKIESELAYPGQIKVVVIRETRVIEYAK